MDNYTLERVHLETETLGSIYDPSGALVCKTMELPWLDNKNSVSCIPEGTYTVIKQPAKPSRNYPYFRIPTVKGRSGILLHRITYVKDLRGCIGVGSRFADLNGDKVPDMTGSGVKLQWMIDNLPDTFTLTIKKKNG